MGRLGISSQGTGTAVTHLGCEEALLQDWGAWVRQTSLGMGYSQLVDLVPSGPLIYSETAILAADKVIAGLPKGHKKTIKRVYWWLDPDVDEIKTRQAVAEFAEKWAVDNTS